MSTLATINGEALAVPGLRFWGNRLDHVFAIIAQDDRGAAELWFDERHGDGGIELHFPSEPQDRLACGPVETCTILGGPCWSDRSLLAYERDFAGLVAAGDSAGVLLELLRWHDESFGAAVTA